ncbi:MAG: 2-phospho-L-lactate transferase [Actinobacteria bacterium]|nr:2-phospho-L-lactate transferase [Actinomycetota bacterium]
MTITALAGGVGGAKCLVGLQRILGNDLTAIVNTGDDAEFYGVHVSPDVDIVSYWLAGIADLDRGWGIKDDTFRLVEGLRGLGEEAWFSLGDRDFATCVLRTGRLSGGATLSAVTDEIRRRLGIETHIIPMSDDPVRTRVTTSDGRSLEFQEYFVKERSQPSVDQILFDGISEAKPAPGVIEALTAADRIIICPSNPLLSIEPILALPGVKNALREHPDVMAVTPIVGGQAIKGPLARMLRDLEMEVSPVAVASLYAGICETFVVDEVDAELAEDIKEFIPNVIVAPTIIPSPDDSEALARVLLA